MRFDRSALAIISLGMLCACSGDTPSGPGNTAPQRTTALPDGWTGGSASSAFVLGLDRTTVHGGKSAGYIASTVANTTAFATLTQFFRADNYRGRRVRWSGWIRSRDVGAAGAGLWMRIDGPGVILAFDNMSSRPITGTSDWRQVSVVLDVPTNAIGIACGALLQAAGDIVVDDFRLDVVGPETPVTNTLSAPAPGGVDSATIANGYARQPVSAVNLDFEGVVGPTLTAATTSWLKTTAVPFATVSPGSDETDLAPLKAMIGNASLVGMGEATHGTREFFQMKHRVFQYLVHQLGFTHFAIEATWPEANDVNTYVLTGNGSPNALLSNLYFWTWNTQEVLDLITWMREWNVATPPEKRVQFLGFDMQYPGAAMDTVAAFIARVDATNSSFVNERYACLSSYRNRGGIFTRIDYVALPQATRTACAAGLKQVSSLFTTNSAAYQAASSSATFANAQHSARLVEQWEDMTSAGTSSAAVRDRYMAENIQWLRSQAPGAKMMLWAHNYHVSNLAGAMGSYLRKTYGADYLTMGFAFGTGGFNAVGGSGTSGALQPFQITAISEGSIEAGFAATAQPRLIFDTRRISGGGDVAAPLAGPIRMRSIGALFIPSQEDAYFSLQIFPSDFDLLIYLATTTPSTLLPFVR